MEELVARVDSMEKTQVSLLVSQAALTERLDNIECNTQELVDLFRNAKAGANFIMFLGRVAKWLGSIIAALVGIWIFYNALKTGVPPSNIPH